LSAEFLFNGNQAEEEYFDSFLVNNLAGNDRNLFLYLPATKINPPTKPDSANPRALFQQHGHSDRNIRLSSYFPDHNSNIISSIHFLSTLEKRLEKEYD